MDYKLEEALEKALAYRRKMRWIYLIIPIILVFPLAIAGKNLVISLLGLLLFYSLTGFMYYLNEKDIRNLNEPEIGEIRGLLSKTKSKKISLGKYNIGDSEQNFDDGIVNTEGLEGSVISATFEVKSGILLLIEESAE